MSTTPPLPVHELRLALTVLLQIMCDEPHALHIDATSTEAGVTFQIRCSPRDVGHLVGKSGRTARAFRVILMAAERKYKTPITLDIIK